MKKKVLLLLATVALLALLMPACIVPAVTPTPVPTISGPAQMVTKVVAPDIAVRDVDINGDGINDYQITTRIVATTYTGLMVGNATGLGTSTQDLRTKITRSSLTLTFWGTVGDSKPGTMALNVTLVGDASNPNLYTFASKVVVLEGSGRDGLEGISGGGLVQGQGPSTAGPFTLTSNFEFRFGGATP